MPISGSGVTVKVVVSDWDLGDRQPALGILEPAGLQVEFCACDTAEELAAAAAEADALINRFVPVTGAVFEKCEKLRIVSRMGIGEWKVDLTAAEDHHVAVAHCPKYCTDESIDHTIALMLAVVRRLDLARSGARQGTWNSYPNGLAIPPLSSMTLGIIGLGRVGSGVANVAKALGLEVIAHDPYVLGAPEDVELVDLATLFAESDIVCLLCPATEETHHVVDRDSLATMKDGSYLVNIARGQLVNEDALIEALDSGRLAGAALDVLEDEPPNSDHPLLNRADIWVTPHVGYYSEESQHELKIHAARNVVHYLTGERVSGLLTPDFRRV